MPQAIEKLKTRGVKIFLHGTSLSLGGAERISDARLAKFARIATVCGCELVSEHIAFVRGSGIESGHLLPVPRTKKDQKGPKDKETRRFEPPRFACLW